MNQPAPSGPAHDGRNTNGASRTVTLDLDGIRHRRKESLKDLDAIIARYDALLGASSLMHPEAVMQERVKLAAEEQFAMRDVVRSLVEMQSATFELIVAMCGVKS